jgi:hypothetical protein
MGSIVYRAPRDPEGDYWVIRHGNLEIWNAMGRIGTLHPVKRGDQHRREKQPKPIEPKKELGL